MQGIRVLLLGDTHVGFDTPRRPRVARRRRGPDFLAAYDEALRPAREGRADLVVHGGDLLHRPGLPATLVEAALAPLRAVAELGVPVFLVPGNHERSHIPMSLLSVHPNLHVFQQPDTFAVRVRGVRVAVSGFPFVRRVRGKGFAAPLARTGWGDQPADLRLLCIHQAVDGARVSGFTFRNRADVVAAADLPAAFDAVLSGHIHRHQVLTHAPSGRPLAAPVFYAGSVERTSFAERDEVKGALHLSLAPGAPVRWRFRPLETRPMHTVSVRGGPGSEARVARALAGLAPDAVVRLDVRDGAPPPAAALRRVTPPTMNVALRWRRGAAI